VRLALAADGTFGALLVATPVEHVRPEGEESLAPRLGTGTWRVASGTGGGNGVIDLVAAFAANGANGTSGASGAKGAKGTDLFTDAGGVLHVEQAGRYTLLVGADDGLRVIVDGKRVLSRDEGRPLREDDDMIPLDLGAGDHTVLFGLHQHAGAWTFKARLLDAELEPPKGASWVLPGAGADVAASLGASLSSVTYDRGLAETGYHPVLTVRYPVGAPRDTPLPVHARLSLGMRTVFDVNAGDVAPGERGMGDVAIALPRVPGGEVEDDDWTLHVDVAGRGLDLPFHPRRAVREAVAHADRALAVATDDSVQYLRDRLATQLNKGDGDVEAQQDDARELDVLAMALEDDKTHHDPWAGRTGPMRRAYVSPLDGKLSEFALYVPPDFDPTRKYPLIVALHGMNGQPMEMLMWLFGHDDPARDGYWEDRHPRRDLEALQAIVVAPGGYFNTMYRDLGEEDVMRVTDWVMAHYPIDEARVTITGPSMGGIGTAACALHHPDRFAAAEPLCGYHSYFVRGDIGGRSMRPWERFIAEQRSNAMWAENGLYIPMWIVHGTKDLPEENSGVLIDRYNELHYAMKHDHPELGHNVWQTTYEDLKGAHWLTWHQRPLHPRSLRFKTAGTRWGDDAWVHVREMASSDNWGEVFARVDKDNGIHALVRGVKALGFSRDAERIDDTRPVTVTLEHGDGTANDVMTFQVGEPIEVHLGHDHDAHDAHDAREGDTWRAGRAPHPGLYKHGHVTGPLRDVLFEPLLIVYGASDPTQTRANEEAARAWAKVRWGVRVSYPILSDVEFAARGEALANDKALVLVGNARSNALVRALEPALPIRIEGDDVVVGGVHVKPTDGPADRSQLGAAFIYPNPKRPDRYVVVIEGVGALGTWRSASLPDILPDYVVYDAGVAPARGALILGGASVRSGGYFTSEWQVPPGGAATPAVLPPLPPVVASTSASSE
jgi:hypothetical protein